MLTDEIDMLPNPVSIALHQNHLPILSKKKGKKTHETYGSCWRRENNGCDD